MSPAMPDEPNQNRRTSMKDMPAEFFLPPPTNKGLWKETAALFIGSYVFILLLSIVVVLTDGIVVRL